MPPSAFEFASLQLDPRRTALLVIDVENEFCHPDGKRFLGQRAFAAVSEHAYSHNDVKLSTSDRIQFAAIAVHAWGDWKC
ncbi:MAG TPA: hypothetical protein VF157_07450 [Chloroflexota bacterium]